MNAHNPTSQPPEPRSLRKVVLEMDHARKTKAPQLLYGIELYMAMVSYHMIW